MLSSSAKTAKLVTELNYIGLDSTSYMNVCNYIKKIETNLVPASYNTCSTSTYQTLYYPGSCSSLDLNWYLTIQLNSASNFTLSAQNLTYAY